METQKIEEAIEEKPGITFTELKKKFDLANGQLQYHLKKGDVTKKDNGYSTKTACKKCRVENCSSKCLREILRKEKMRKICHMLEDGKMKKDIAEELSISVSTLSYHINKLKETNAIVDGKPTQTTLELIDELNS